MVWPNDRSYGSSLVFGRPLARINETRQEHQNMITTTTATISYIKEFPSITRSTYMPLWIWRNYSNLCAERGYENPGVRECRSRSWQIWRTNRWSTREEKLGKATYTYEWSMERKESDVGYFWAVLQKPVMMWDTLPSQHSSISWCLVKPTRFLSPSDGLNVRTDRSSRQNNYR